MTKTRFTSEVFVRGGKIIRLHPIGFENAPVEQLQTLQAVKSVIHAWLRKYIDNRIELQNSTITIGGAYSESSSKLTVDFKVKSCVRISKT